MKPINKKTSPILLTLCAFFFLASHMATAKTYTSVKNGNFNDCTVWATMLVEQKGNDVFVIASGHTITVPRNVKMYLSKIVLTDATSRVILTDATSVLSTTGAGATLDCSSDYRLSVALESFQTANFADEDDNYLNVNFIARLLELDASTSVPLIIENATIEDREGAEEISYHATCGFFDVSWAGGNRRLLFAPLRWNAKLDYDATQKYELWFSDVYESDSPGLHDYPTGIDKTIISGNLLDVSGARVSIKKEEGSFIDNLRFDNRRLEAALLTPDADYNITVDVHTWPDNHCGSIGVWRFKFRARFEKK